MGFYEEAEKKLAEGQKASCGRYGDVMKKDVAAALLNFCEQDEEFAQAVAQGGSFKDCMAAVAKKVKGSSISDMEAFGAAVRFYFPGAGIKVKMTIDLCADVTEEEDTTPDEIPEDVDEENEQETEAAAEEPKPEKSGVVIDLSDFF